MTHPGQILKQAKLYAGKELGQNFFSDPAAAKQLVKRTGITKDTCVLEIGPGLGALTVHIAEQADEVTAVEKDSRLIPLLNTELEKKAIRHVNILNTDILRLDISELVRDKKLVVIGNLPYNISSQILFKLVEQRQWIKRAYLMFQKELALRILASPGGRDYSRLSAVVQYACSVKKVTEVGPASFFPKPEVDSAVLEFSFFQDTGLDFKQEKMLFSVIKAAFSKRRKTLRNSLAGPELGLDKKQAAILLDKAGIDTARRAETLSVDEFKLLAMSVMSAC